MMHSRIAVPALAAVSTAQIDEVVALAHFAEEIETLAETISTLAKSLETTLGKLHQQLRFSECNQIIALAGIAQRDGALIRERLDELDQARTIA